MDGEVGGGGGSVGEEGGCYVAGCGVGVVEGLEVRLVGGGGGVGGRSGEVRFDFLGVG